MLELLHCHISCIDPELIRANHLLRVFRRKRCPEIHTLLAGCKAWKRCRERDCYELRNWRNARLGIDGADCMPDVARRDGKGLDFNEGYPWHILDQALVGDYIYNLSKVKTACKCTL